MAPNIVTKHDENRIWVRLSGCVDTNLKRHRKVDVCAKVRISHIKGAFDNGYMPNWFCEQFTVSSMVSHADKKSWNSRPVYALKDESGEELRGKLNP